MNFSWCCVQESTDMVINMIRAHWCNLWVMRKTSGTGLINWFILYPITCMPLIHTGNILILCYDDTVKAVLSWEDHLSWQTKHFWQKNLHFNITEPVTRDHLSWQTTFLWPMGWSFKTVSTIYWFHVYSHPMCSRKIPCFRCCAKCINRCIGLQCCGILASAVSDYVLCKATGLLKLVMLMSPKDIICNEDHKPPIWHQDGFWMCTYVLLHFLLKLCHVRVLIF